MDLPKKRRLKCNLERRSPAGHKMRQLDRFRFSARNRKRLETWKTTSRNHGQGISIVLKKF